MCPLNSRVLFPNTGTAIHRYIAVCHCAGICSRALRIRCPLRHRPPPDPNRPHAGRSRVSVEMLLLGHPASATRASRGQDAPDAPPRPPQQAQRGYLAGGRMYHTPDASAARLRHREALPPHDPRRRPHHPHADCPPVPPSPTTATTAVCLSVSGTRAAAHPPLHR